ncbi:3-oxoacyl-[acyl-carrier-protein] synthase III [Roseivirga ehrenbergii]|uniref:Beta-ketoacyl-[acyl-carrier-protein] synthase III n=1 Tax=Roseivirga ehrenbergii (strain DSM 102268 / JCM 13514 / KCTC 12282 / NCIMB 14502 / KMM 6017) TaxID=279360 RepID=A0A150WYY7_ROSEK|nr:beta-ketoacyl-ACP synthase III [Roseivirga ehrenbergii]KYG71693.1 3-oxoacyl-ACP synthase [Roseivirga ehrenbergii]TCL07614.1 3-oxoacyl-[acyl-carrier-protein] synthase III [Roseivirga ehrenbergii]
MKSSRIVGLGHYVPKNIVKNTDLEKIIDTSNEWIIERTGIEERRWFDPEQDTVSNMATKAAKMALERAKTDVSEVDFIVFATITPDYFFPGSGVLMQRELGLQGIGALDIRNACSGFIYALSIADQFIKTGMYKTVLVVGAEIQSSAIDKSTAGRSSAVIFADGAGAAVLKAAEPSEGGILSTHLHADGDFAEELYVKDPGSSRTVRLSQELIEGPTFHLTMNGNAVFKHAVVRFSEVIAEALAANNLSAEDIDLLVPHQANLRISNYVQKQLNMPDEKVFNNIMHYGNTTAASIPIALSEAWEQGKIKEGDLVCLAAFGSGFTWASALIRW